MKVVNAKAASPSGAGSATGASSTRVGRARSSARTAMATSLCARPGAGSAESRLLVYLEPDAVAERVVEAVPEHLAGLLGQKRREAVLLEDVAGEAVQVLAGDAGLDGRNGAVERLAAELVVLDQLVGGLADDEGARHVRIAA